MHLLRRPCALAEKTQVQMERCEATILRMLPIAAKTHGLLQSRGDVPHYPQATPCCYANKAERTRYKSHETQNFTNQLRTLQLCHMHAAHLRTLPHMYASWEAASKSHSSDRFKQPLEMAYIGLARFAS